VSLKQKTTRLLFLQKTQNNIREILIAWKQMILSIVFMFFSGFLIGQTKTTVNYHSLDSLLLTADVYVANDSLPFLILFHEQNSSRGEFISIIDRFLKMNYNCLAVDLRNGGNSNSIGNKTTQRCREEGLSRSVYAVEGDIKASIDYAFKCSGKPVVLIGSAANGALALKAAKEQELVKAAISLSPGEFFLANFTIEDIISGIQKPILLTSSKIEFPYVKQMASKVEDTYKTVFAPENSEGKRGTSALLPNNPSNSEYWLAILFFFKDLQ
jgi:dienelactone hydrolase